MTLPAQNNKQQQLSDQREIESKRAIVGVDFSQRFGHAQTACSHMLRQAEVSRVTDARKE